MRNETVNLTVTIPKDVVLTSIHPITRGPYMGYDVLLLLDDLCGKAFVIRAKLTGEHLSTTEKVKLSEGPELVRTLLIKQSDADCSAVTGGGRWGCE